MPSTEKAGHAEEGAGSGVAEGKQAQRYGSHNAIVCPAQQQGQLRRRESLIEPCRFPNRTALILYGSETGNAQDVAEEIGHTTERLRFDTTVLDLNSVPLKDLLKPTVVIFATSTTGQGEMPQNARGFWNKLRSNALKPGMLRKVRFSSFGLGDSSYAQYNVAHRVVCRRMSQLGAQSFCERGEGDEQHPEGHSAGFREWVVLLRQRLLDAFPLPDGVDPIAEDVFVEPKWRLERGNATISQQTNGMHKEEDSINISRPSSALLPVINSYTATVDRNDRITAQDHFQDVRLLDLRVNENVHYGPGAVAVVYPKNFPEDVQAFIELMSWQDIADMPLSLTTNQDLSAKQLATPSPLRNFDLSKVKLTMRWLLENVLDIMSIPRRSFFAGLVHFARQLEDDDLRKEQLVERLVELANPDLIDELWDYTTRPKRTLLEAMADFTPIKISWQYALTALPVMRGRQFSIASGGSLKVTDTGRTRIQLLIAIADPPSPIIKYRRRYGVCTRYITALHERETINIGIQPGYLDVDSSELDVPVIMIGPGTGLAPMRSMIHERIIWAQQGEREMNSALNGDILFFGCRNEQKDYFFRDEWESFAKNNGLTVCTAFSRDQDKPREYVQHQIRAHGTDVCEALLKRNGKVYVCGSSGNMPKGVREALVDVLCSGGALSVVEAENYLKSMEKSGRYKQETW